ncbi:MAG: sugar kinase [Calditrichia bacterium]
MARKVVTFGEIMLRLAPYRYERVIQAHEFQATYGGGEANVAVSLAQFGHEAYFVSRVPDNALGEASINHLRAFGVNCDYVLKGGDRLGIYFLEHGASIRPSKVIYDRKYSSISFLTSEMLDWNEILKGKDWFHLTGITPALSPLVAQTALEAVKTAKKYGVTVSCDLNYRKKLWSREAARKTMSELVQYVDVLIANEEDAYDVFGIQAENTDIDKGIIQKEAYQHVAKELMGVSGAKKVAITLRESISASDNNWSAMLYSDGQAYYSRKYPLHLVDRVGGGDSFGAGLIHGLLSGWNDEDALQFAVAASALKQTLPGDMNLVKEDEVLTVVKGNTSGRVQR